MARNTVEKYLSVLGLVAWGDLNELTMYRSHRGPIVWFAKTRPEALHTPDQFDQKYRMNLAAEAWKCLTPAGRRAWHDLAKSANLCMTGYDLWVFWHMTQRRQAIEALMRIYGVAVPLLPPKPPQSFKRLKEHKTRKCKPLPTTRIWPTPRHLFGIPGQDNWIYFLVWNENYAEPCAVAQEFALVGPGIITAQPFANRLPTLATYTAFLGESHATLHAKATWPDGSLASCSVTIHCRDALLPFPEP